MTQEKLNAFLIKACEFGYLSKIKKCIEMGADVNYQDEYGRTPLHIAAAIGCSGMANMLVRAGGKTNIKDFLGCTPISDAEYNGNSAVYEILEQAVKEAA